MLGRRAGLEGGAARLVWSTHFWNWLWRLQQKILRRQMLGGGGGEQDPQRCVHLGPPGVTSLGNRFCTDVIIHDQVMVS